MTNRVASWGGGEVPPTDEERREAARELRQMVRHGLNGYSVVSALEHVTGESWLSGIFMRLADLIEPLPERTAEFSEVDQDGDEGYLDGFCSACWAEAGLDDKYCHSCGARLVG